MSGEGEAWEDAAGIVLAINLLAWADAMPTRESLAEAICKHDQHTSPEFSTHAYPDALHIANALIRDGLVRVGRGADTPATKEDANESTRSLAGERRSRRDPTRFVTASDRRLMDDDYEDSVKSREDAQARASMPNDEAYRAGFEAAMEQVNSNQQQTPNYAQMAVETGQLVYRDEILDDDEGSPTFDKFISVFHGTQAVE